MAVCRIWSERDGRGAKMVWCVWVIRMRNRSNNKEDYKTRLKKNRRSRLEERKKKSVCFFELFFSYLMKQVVFLVNVRQLGV